MTSGATSPARATPRVGAGTGAPANSGAPARGGFARRGTSATPAPAGSGVAKAQFAQRSNGGTAGVTRSGGRAVFGTPAAKSSKSRAGARRAAPSARSASGDLWNGFKPQARSSVFAAEATAGQQAGGAPFMAAAIVLGVGLAGLLASASVLGLRRRRAEARATRSGSGTTEM